MGETGANKKVTNSLVALSSAAVLAVYSAGYQRTKAAADRFERLAASRRQAAPAPAVAGAASAPDTPVPGASPESAGGVAADGTRAPVPGADSAGFRPQPPSPTAATSDTAGSVPAGVFPSGPVPGSPVPASPVTAPVTPGTEGAPASAPASGPTPIPVAPAAAPSAEAPAAASAAPADVLPVPPEPRGRFADGTYQGRGSCIHGDIQAQVVVRNGRIVEATISSCETRYSCDWLDPILSQVAARQSAFVDSVSGATDSTDAFSAAVADALLKAQ